VEFDLLTAIAGQSRSPRLRATRDLGTLHHAETVISTLRSSCVIDLIEYA